MRQILLFTLLGLGPGALIAGVALGVVLAYRGAGVINMAAGAVAVWGAYVFYGLRVNHQLFLPPLPLVPHFIDTGTSWSGIPAFLVALLYCALLAVLFEYALLRPLRTRAPLAKLLASLGVLLTLQAIIELRFGSDGQTASTLLPQTTTHLLGIQVGVDLFLIAGIVIVATLGLMALYRFTPFGLSTRAASENETNAMFAGLHPNRLSLINIVFAFVLAGALGVLAAPRTQLDPVTIPLTIVPALGAALLARFESFGIAAVAGIAMGIIQELVVYLQSLSWFPTTSGQAIPGVTDLIFLLIIIGAMFWRGASLPERGQLAERRLPAAPAPVKMLKPAAIGVAVLFVAFLVLPYDWRQATTNSLIGSVVCLSLVVITGFVGQVSVVQIGLSGVSGFVISKLGVHAGLGFPLAAIIGCIAALVVGELVAVSALRVRGVSLAIVTIAAAVALESFGFDNPTWGGGAAGSPVNQPHLWFIDLGTTAHFPISGGTLPSPVFGLFCVVFCAACCLLVGGVRRSGLGHRMLAVRSNERAAAAAGISVARIKLVAFGLSSLLAGVAGALYAYNFGSVSGDRFDLITSLTFISFAYIGGITTVQGAILAGLGVTEGLLNHLFNDKLGVPAEYQFLLGGLALISILIFKPEGLASSEGAPSPVELARRGIGLVRPRGGRDAKVGDAPS